MTIDHDFTVPLMLNSPVRRSIMRKQRTNTARSNELKIFRGIAENIGLNQNLIPPIPLTGFMAMIGKSYEHDLMVVGRAVNGWSSGWCPQALNEVQYINVFVKEVFESVTKGNPCPMCWVSDCWGNYDQDYNTKKSAFWRVIRQVVSELKISDIENPSWPSRLVWSNLYKIAPAAGFNPSATLCNLQFNGCKDLLIEEIKTYKPKRLLFLTGGWVNDFLTDFSHNIKSVGGNNYVEQIGNMKFNHGTETAVVIVAHPQGKKETILVQEVVKAFDNLL